MQDDRRRVPPPAQHPPPGDDIWPTEDETPPPRGGRRRLEDKPTGSANDRPGRPEVNGKAKQPGDLGSTGSRPAPNGSAPNAGRLPARAPGAVPRRDGPVRHSGSLGPTPPQGGPGPAPQPPRRQPPQGTSAPPRRGPVQAPRPQDRRATHPAEARTELIPPVVEDEPTVFIQAHRGSLGYRDPETERIDSEPDDRVHLDDPADYADDALDDDHHPADDEFDDEPPPAKRKDSAAFVVVRSLGEAMVTLGIVVLLFVVYEVWVTDLVSAEKQEDVTVALDEQWHQPTAADPQRQQKFEFADGEGMAKLYIPALGDDYHFTIVEGTSTADLETGPGHYKKSALPGQPGNFAVAGHRVGKGAPFNDLDLLSACDAMVVETQTSWFVYRMLPTNDDAKNWTAKAADPKCAGVAPQTGDYAKATGRQIVSPAQSEVVAPVPGNPSAKTPAAERQKMITLTTCHPKFSNRQRMILQGVLVREQPKNAAEPTAVPAELRETG
ncbi:class E sortase [Actinokineospora globicatena]|uniref:class E sortase n=1 Tax=Actinokineospora globicatena TaxID=103729 RepID=UPI0020A26CC6|nr:class E sortase [Actinokineospora globicatena]MCP2305051.1 LPXTG-site transpeptidase (sortase) family protein [Actinokineospora globicatena]GLW80516.1 hypothetical protein Aglo01_49970 [Actinokineospora globicatena]GLW87344.1 hypothetical protein Aglo02_49830 [Actinokineospora globicatena]